MGSGVLKKVASIKRHDPLPSFQAGASSQPWSLLTGGEDPAARVDSEDAPGMSPEGPVATYSCNSTWKGKHLDV